MYGAPSLDYRPTMVHHSKARIQALTQFIVESTGASASSFEVSDVKRDGTVFVKFRSSSTVGESAVDRACRLNLALQDTGKRFSCPSDVQFRIPLEQFNVDPAV